MFLMKLIVKTITQISSVPYSSALNISIYNFCLLKTAQFSHPTPSCNVFHGYLELLLWSGHTGLFIELFPNTSCFPSSKIYFTRLLWKYARWSVLCVRPSCVFKSIKVISSNQNTLIMKKLGSIYVQYIRFGIRKPQKVEKKNKIIKIRYLEFWNKYLPYPQICKH